MMTARLPRIHLIGTGGTIAGTQRSQSSIGYDAGGIDVSELITAVPSLGKVAELSAEQVFSIGSQNMDDAAWLTLAERIGELATDADIDGAVIMHGTDTMEETAYFLDLVTPLDFSVVMVGAMRPSTAASADGPGNLYSGVTAAKTAKGRGVLVCFNNEIHYARRIVKTDTVGLHGFISPRRGLAGVVHSDHVEWFDGGRARECRIWFEASSTNYLPRVDVIYVHAGMSSDLIQAAVDLGAQGLVIAGVGGGNIPKASVDVLAKVVASGIPVVRSTRLQSGIVMRNVEIDDDKCRFVASGDLNAAKSRVLLKLALTKTASPEEIQAMFDRR